MCQLNNLINFYKWQIFADLIASFVTLTTTINNTKDFLIDFTINICTTIAKIKAFRLWIVKALKGQTLLVMSLVWSLKL